MLLAAASGRTRLTTIAGRYSELRTKYKHLARPSAGFPGKTGQSLLGTADPDEHANKRAKDLASFFRSVLLPDGSSHDTQLRQVQ